MTAASVHPSDLLRKVKKGDLDWVLPRLAEPDVRKLVFQPDGHGDCIFSRWAEFDATPLVEALEAHGIDWTPQLAAVWGRIDVLTQLADGDPSALMAEAPPHGNAMCAALRYGRVEAAKWLVEQGIDIAATDAGYVRAAAQGRSEAGIRFAVKHGADVDYTPNTGGTALYYEAKHNRWKMVPALMECGADANRKDEVSGLTPLEVALAAKDKSKRLIYLLKGGKLGDPPRRGVQRGGPRGGPRSGSGHRGGGGGGDYRGRR